MVQTRGFKQAMRSFAHLDVDSLHNSGAFCYINMFPTERIGFYSQQLAFQSNWIAIVVFGFGLLASGLLKGSTKF